ncbi:MAG: hypothetical protein OXT74_06630 [Candidatus Poribacteria bacterium]|nr:hypothetical protein [Candidatus Poribacteria bacterium]
MTFRKLQLGITFTIAILAVSGCGSTKLLDIEKTSKTLKLSANQREIARTKIQQIEKLVEDYQLEKETLETELSEMRNQRRSRTTGFGGRGRLGGNRGAGMGGSLQAKMQSFYQQRKVYQNQIDTLIAEMQVILDDEQREKFSDIKLPELKMPEIGREGGFGGNRRRGGGRFGAFDG